MSHPTPHDAAPPMTAPQATGMALMRGDFRGAAELAEAGLRALDAADLHGDVWRQLTYLRCVAIRYNGETDEALKGFQEVRDAARVDGDHMTLLKARSAISVLIFYAGRPDEALREIDEVLAMAESPIATGAARIECCMLAASAASQIGLTAIGDSLMTVATDGVAAGDGDSLSAPLLLSLRGGQVQIRSQQAMSLEYADHPAAQDAFARILELCQDAENLYPGMPDKPAQLFRAHRALALVALGRSEEAAGLLGELLSESYDPDFLGQLTELAVGFASSRAGLIPPEVDRVAFGRRLVSLAQLAQQPQQEAEAHRQLAVAAEALGEQAVAAASLQRFDALLSDLDWKVRLRRVQAGQFRSRMLADLAGQS